MYNESQIPTPFLFNPLKHHISFIREFINDHQYSGNGNPPEEVVKSIKHIGGSVMDIYTGPLAALEILTEIATYIRKNKIIDKLSFSVWAGTENNDFRVIELSDQSIWTLKYFESENRFIHLFPARFSPHSFRVKANTLKSAILYNICIGKDFVSEEDLNRARAIGGLSPVKDVIDSEAISEMIEILRG
jgi:hypothetical protein